MEHTRPTVAIVGAGPVVLSLALGLARQGIGTAVAEGGQQTSRESSPMTGGPADPGGGWSSATRGGGRSFAIPAVG